LCPVAGVKLSWPARTEFDTGVAGPGYHEVFRIIEDSAGPVVAAVHGTAGAGTEIALACHYRVAHEGARFGLPDSEIDRLPIAVYDPDRVDAAHGSHQRKC
jgi:enoyl-CoA hydratase/carnithine racemase